MEDKITKRMQEIQNKYKNRSGKVETCFSVGYWLIRVARVGLNDAFNEFSEKAEQYIEGGHR
jgi:hypothetical protein